MAKDAGARRRLGQYGENLAARYLGDRGLVVVDRNWRCARGEIDLVARDDDCLVFCEVKTRRSLRFGDPVEAITTVKLARLRRLAVFWLQAHEMSARRIRIDVIAIVRPPSGPAQLRHLAGVGA